MSGSSTILLRALKFLYIFKWETPCQTGLVFLCEKYVHDIIFLYNIEKLFARETIFHKC